MRAATPLREGAGRLGSFSRTGWKGQQDPPDRGRPSSRRMQYEGGGVPLRMRVHMPQPAPPNARDCQCHAQAPPTRARCVSHARSTSLSSRVRTSDRDIRSRRTPAESSTLLSGDDFARDCVCHGAPVYLLAGLSRCSRPVLLGGLSTGACRDVRPEEPEAQIDPSDEPTARLGS